MSSIPVGVLTTIRLRAAAKLIPRARCAVKWHLSRAYDGSGFACQLEQAEKSLAKQQSMTDCLIVIAIAEMIQSHLTGTSGVMASLNADTWLAAENIKMDAEAAKHAYLPVLACLQCREPLGREVSDSLYDCFCPKCNAKIVAVVEADVADAERWMR